MIVRLNFGDGSFHEIDVEETDPAEAVVEARKWVQDNAWFEVGDEETLVQLAEERF